MSTDDAKADLTSLPDVIAVLEEHKSSLDVTVAVPEIENSADSQKLLSGDPTSADKSDSSLSPDTTSSGLSDEEDIPGVSSEADVSSSKDKCSKADVSSSKDASSKADVSSYKDTSSKADVSSSKDASSKADTPLAKSWPKVRFASEVNEISASVASEDNEESGDNAFVRDNAVAGTSGESTQSAIQEEPENLVERSGEIANRGCCPEHQGFVEYFRISMMHLRESKYLLPFQFLMLSMPVSCGFMGSKYMEKCPASSAIPLLLFMIGILGTVVVCARIYAIFKKCLFPYSDWSSNVRSTLIAGLLMLTILYTAELGFFFTAKPTFSHGSDDYCDETFYYFVSYMNYISIALVIVLLLLHCPGTNPCGLIYIPQVLRD